MPKCDFNKVAKQITLWHGCSSVNLLHVFRTPLEGCFCLELIFIRSRGVFRTQSIISKMELFVKTVNHFQTCNYFRKNFHVTYLAGF